MPYFILLQKFSCSQLHFLFVVLTYRILGLSHPSSNINLSICCVIMSLQPEVLDGSARTFRMLLGSQYQLVQLHYHCQLFLCIYTSHDNSYNRYHSPLSIMSNCLRPPALKGRNCLMHIELVECSVNTLCLNIGSNQTSSRDQHHKVDFMTESYQVQIY